MHKEATPRTRWTCWTCCYGRAAKELAPWSAVPMQSWPKAGTQLDTANGSGVPRMNGKTTPRDISLFSPFAHLLWEWSTGKPLVAKTGEQWPATGQSIEPNMPLFPGYRADGQKRCADEWLRWAFEAKKNSSEFNWITFVCHIALPLMNNMEYPPFVDAFLFGKAGFVIPS